MADRKSFYGFGKRDFGEVQSFG
ncbi:hypothetical protein CCACVL1_03637 [Corchorus capsularis]|uniref:Uncharacterized protein n=1 Tax=Corchorus capsularis TaxID=210143 RepID=A0A1R3JY46_COCAP|nr:hypothetical protein CCACVL1_03637 [Corchorus capsularis]